MDSHIISVVQACTHGSDEERLTFPAIIGQLMEAGIERYTADFCRLEKTFYLPSGESQVVPCLRIPGEPATTFSAKDVESAVRASQSQQIRFQEFCRRAMAAGCVGYLVSLAGRRVVYYGRTGDLHIEHFPAAKS